MEMILKASYFSGLFLAASAGIASAASYVPPTPIPARALAEVPKIQSVSMSTDGKQIVALLGKQGAEEYEASLATWDLNNLEKAPVVTASGDRMRFVAASALKADRLLVIGRQEWTGLLAGCGEGNSKGNTATFITKFYLTDAKHSNFSEAFADSTRKTGISDQTRRCLEIAGSARLVSNLPLDPESVIISQLDMTSFQTSYYRFNLRTNEATLLLRDTGRTTPGLFNPRDGELLTKSEIVPTGGDYDQLIYIRKKSSPDFEVHSNLTTKLSERITFNFIGIDEASGSYYVLTDKFSDKVQLHAYNAETRVLSPEPLLSHPMFSISSLILGTRPSDFNKILGYTVSAMVPETTWVDPQLKGFYDSIKKTYPNQTVSVLSYSDDRSKVLFSTESARHSPAYHLLMDGKRVVTLGSERPDIKPESIGEQRWVTYKARDGMQIPAILDLPAGWSKDKGPLPAIIHPHGGPWARDFGGWDGSGWVPYLTSRGYAVLRPQYRGTTGLGRKLWIAGDAEWGQKMQDDKDDGAQWLVEQGIARKDSLVIFGYSYGGFAAAAATVRPGGPYRCAIAGAPVTDLTKLSNNWSESRIQRFLQGRTVKGMDPLANADKASIPILLYVGDRDVRTPAFHAEDFYKAVKGKVTAKYQLIPDMPHSLPWYPRHQTQTLGLIENFLNTDCRLQASN
jgi:dienelactone hydrolase